MISKNCDPILNGDLFNEITETSDFFKKLFSDDNKTKIKEEIERKNLSEDLMTCSENYFYITNLFFCVSFLAIWETEANKVMQVK